MSYRKRIGQPITSQIKMRRVVKKELQPNVMTDGAPNQLAIAAIPNEANEETRPQIFKLDVDCVQEMFDYLSIGDIGSIAGTCTRMQKIAGDYFQTYLSTLQLHCYDDVFRTFHGRNMKGVEEFVQKLYIYESVNDEGYRSIGLHCKLLKQIYFSWESQLNATRIEYIKPILSKIEYVRFWPGVVKGEFYGSFLQFCPNLKQLSIRNENSNVIIGTNNEWLHRNYASLEHLELRTRGDLEIPELETFFERNPNLKTLEINGNAFLTNINAMLNAKIKLQELVLDEDEETICRHLDQLHTQGFYQRLHLKMSCYRTYQSTVDRISTLNGLEKLYLYLFKGSPMLNFNSLTSVKELGLIIYSFSNPFQIDVELTAKSLVNLERLYFDKVKSEMIDSFIQYSAKLKAIKIKILNGRNSIDLTSLNKKRETLVGSKKVTIYLEEDAFLATKWSNKSINLKMIEVKRAESIDWQKPLSI